MPWQGLKAKDKSQKYARITEKKVITPVEDLCNGYPQEFSIYLNYCRSLKFEEKPDYKYLRKVFRDLFFRLGYKYDYQWDWMQTVGNIRDENIPRSPEAVRSNDGTSSLSLFSESL